MIDGGEVAYLVVREEGAVQHVRVGQEDAAARAQIGTLGLRRVAVVRVDWEAEEGAGAGVCHLAEGP